MSATSETEANLTFWKLTQQYMNHEKKTKATQSKLAEPYPSYKNKKKQKQKNF